MLQLKTVHRNKEGQLTLYGMPGALVLAILGVTFMLIYFFGWKVGLFAGAVFGTLGYATFANKPPMWCTYHVMAAWKGRGVLVAAAAPPLRIELALEEARRAYEQ